MISLAYQLQQRHSGVKRYTRPLTPRFDFAKASRSFDIRELSFQPMFSPLVDANGWLLFGSLAVIDMEADQSLDVRLLPVNINDLKHNSSILDFSIVKHTRDVTAESIMPTIKIRHPTSPNLIFTTLSTHIPKYFPSTRPTVHSSFQLSSPTQHPINHPKCSPQPLSPPSASH